VSLSDQELIERVKRSYQAFNRGDFDAATEGAHPDLVIVRPGGQPELQGADAVRAWMKPDAFESQTTELLEFEVEANRVLTRQRTAARGAGSGIEIEIDSWSVWTFDDQGRITRLELYLHHEEEAARRALRAP
jgi:ketosteroid isomerase-like protein